MAISDQAKRLILDVLQSSQVGLGLVRNRILSWANDAFLKMVGYLEAEMYNKNVAMLYPSIEEYDMVGTTLYQMIKDRGIGVVNTRLIRKDRQPLACCLIALPAQRSDPSLGQLVAAVEIGEDPSTVGTPANTPEHLRNRIKQMEAHLRQSHKLEAIGSLAGGIAHDFNNIIGAIVGYAELAQLSVSADQPEVNHCLENIVKAGQRAKELVRQILSFSTQPTGKQVPVCVGNAVQEALTLLRATLPATTEIRQQLSPSSDTVLADPTQIHQVVLNLCTNAHHAMGEAGGTLTVTVDHQIIDAGTAAADPELKPGPYVQLTVGDTGCGMPPEVIAHIFDPYFTTKGTDQGTGLGLSLVSSIVQRQGGVIRVSSSVGKGSVFTILLPAYHGRDEIQRPASTKDLPRGTERVLFVDDEYALSDLGKRMLEHLGYQVTIYNSSPLALDAFRAAPQAFDLIVTDMSMPKMSGKQFAQEIMKIRPDIPIIICTGHSDLISAETAKAMGIRGFILKPMNFEQISRAIREVLDD